MEEDVELVTQNFFSTSQFQFCLHFDRLMSFYSIFC